MQSTHEEAGEWTSSEIRVVWRGQVSMELKRRVDDLELQLAGRAGLSEEELQVCES